MLSEGTGKSIATYAVILGVFYVAIGFIEFATGLWDLVAPGTAKSLVGLPMDLYGGFAALVIGAAYFGAVPLWKGKHESLGFILVGVLLSVVFGTVYLLIVGADGFGALLACWGEEGWVWEGWTWEWLTAESTIGIGILRPEIWLFFASLPLGIYTLRITKTEKVR